MPRAIENLPIGLTLGIGAGLIGIRIWFHLASSPVPDEAYYWLWGQNLDWGYYDHPPLQAWFQGLSAALFGASKFALRLPTVLTTLILIYAFYRISALVQIGARAQFTLLVGVFASPLFFTFTSLAFNDHVMLAALGLAGLWAFEEALNLQTPSHRPNRLRLIGIGLALGFATLAKFNAVFFALGLFVFLLLDPPSRRLFRTPAFYGAGLIAGLCLTPVLWWNAYNGAPTFDYNFNQRLSAASGIGDWGTRALTFLIAFGLSAGPLVWLGLFRDKCVGALATLRRLALTILWVSTLGFLLLSYQTYVLFYWNLPALILALPVFVMGFKRQLTLIAHMGFGFFFSALLIINYTFFPLSALSGQVDKESAIMHGWPEIRAWVLETEQQVSPDFLAASDYRSGSILAFWLNRSDIDVVAERLSQFTLWSDPAARAGQSVLLLTSNWFPLEAVHWQHFKDIREISRLDVQIFSYPITTYKLYLGTGISHISN